MIVVRFHHEEVCCNLLEHNLLEGDNLHRCSCHGHESLPGGDNHRLLLVCIHHHCSHVLGDSLLLADDNHHPLVCIHHHCNCHVLGDNYPVQNVNRSSKVVHDLHGGQQVHAVLVVWIFVSSLQLELEMVRNFCIKERNENMGLFKVSRKEIFRLRSGHWKWGRHTFGKIDSLFLFLLRFSSPNGSSRC